MRKLNRLRRRLGYRLTQNTPRVCDQFVVRLRVLHWEPESTLSRIDIPARDEETAWEIAHEAVSALYVRRYPSGECDQGTRWLQRKLGIWGMIRLVEGVFHVVHSEHAC